MDLYNRLRCLLAVLAVFVFAPVAAVAQETGVQQWSFDRSTFDFSADPCGDFYQHVCGAWSNPANDPEMRRLRTFVAACMTQNPPTDRAARKTAQPWLGRIDGIKTHEQFMAVLRELHAHGVNAFFRDSGEPHAPARFRTNAPLFNMPHLRMPSPAPPPHRWCGPPPRAVRFGV